MDPRADWRIRRHADVMVLGVERNLPILPVRWTVPSSAAQVGPIAHEIHEGEMSVHPVLDEEVQQRYSIAALVIGPSLVGLDRYLQITPGGVKHVANLVKALRVRRTARRFQFAGVGLGLNQNLCLVVMREPLPYRIPVMNRPTLRPSPLPLLSGWVLRVQEL